MHIYSFIFVTWCTTVSCSMWSNRRTALRRAIALQAQFSAAVKEGYQASLTRHQGEGCISFFDGFGGRSIYRDYRDEKSVRVSGLQPGWGVVEFAIQQVRLRLFHSTMSPAGCSGFQGIPARVAVFQSQCLQDLDPVASALHSACRLYGAR